ncbi:hypothetical protein HOG17_04920 [Candidatus Peregrinibacteria bacterium]|jgi:hypothetical protein|nr:hypothetical protein [Candidatus Peregrinibacteria bacterium]MBT4148520.1 hypothetical protein [Candidatus Peregrinibacteria bacterium]MBT4366699.1 hypothetical protein [Candidatus Peregrinibacteria bacterium]MBT4455532.1 hypothetical protein [Candidatus Peregrinibacteria bacterium]
MVERIQNAVSTVGESVADGFVRLGKDVDRMVGSVKDMITGGGSVKTPAEAGKFLPQATMLGNGLESIAEGISKSIEGIRATLTGEELKKFNTASKSQENSIKALKVALKALNTSLIVLSEVGMAGTEEVMTEEKKSKALGAFKKELKKFGTVGKKLMDGFKNYRETYLEVSRPEVFDIDKIDQLPVTMAEYKEKREDVSETTGSGLAEISKQEEVEMAIVDARFKNKKLIDRFAGLTKNPDKPFGSKADFQKALKFLDEVAKKRGPVGKAAKSVSSRLAYDGSKNLLMIGAVFGGNPDYDLNFTDLASELGVAMNEAKAKGDYDSLVILQEIEKLYIVYTKGVSEIYERVGENTKLIENLKDIRKSHEGITSALNTVSSAPNNSIIDFEEPDLKEYYDLVSAYSSELGNSEVLDFAMDAKKLKKLEKKSSSDAIRARDLEWRVTSRVDRYVKRRTEKMFKHISDLVNKDEKEDGLAGWLAYPEEMRGGAYYTYIRDDALFELRREYEDSFRGDNVEFYRPYRIEKELIGLLEHYKSSDEKNNMNNRQEYFTSHKGLKAEVEKMTNKILAGAEKLPYSQFINLTRETLDVLNKLAQDNPVINIPEIHGGVAKLMSMDVDGNYLGFLRAVESSGVHGSHVSMVKHQRMLPRAERESVGYAMVPVYMKLYEAWLGQAKSRAWDLSEKEESEREEAPIESLKNESDGWGKEIGLSNEENNNPKLNKAWARLMDDRDELYVARDMLKKTDKEVHEAREALLDDEDNLDLVRAYGKAKSANEDAESAYDEAENKLIRAEERFNTLKELFGGFNA